MELSSAATRRTRGGSAECHLREYDDRRYFARTAGPETRHPAAYNFREGDFLTSALRPVEGSPLCEFKGQARFWSLQLGDRLSARAAWSYPYPSPAFLLLANYFAFYASRVDARYVADERVRPQAPTVKSRWETLISAKRPFFRSPRSGRSRIIRGWPRRMRLRPGNDSVFWRVHAICQLY